MSFRLVVPGQTPSSKNSKQVGRNKYTGKTFFSSSKAYTKWKKVLDRSLKFHKDCRALAEWYEVQDKIPVYAVFFFFRQTKAKYDFVNMCQGPLDMIQTYGGLPDDDIAHVIPVFGGSWHDKENPRCEINFREYEVVTNMLKAVVAYGL